MIWLGCDPGAKGGMAAIYTDENGTQKVAVAGWDNELFINFCKSFKQIADAKGEQVVAAVEKVGAVHGNGLVSSFSFGKSAGFIEGVLAALSIPYQLILPKEWKKLFGLNSDKQKSIDVCKHLYPGVSLLPNERCRKDSDGMAESLLLATYAKRKL